jgi:ABC-type Zn uptake system ZnuABC Zn-binding protein ZnuA
VSRSLLRSCAAAFSLVFLVALAACSSGTSSFASSRSSTGDGVASAESKVAGFTCSDAAQRAGADQPGPADGKRLQVVTTVAPITSIVANVAGDQAQVTGIIPEGEDSHTFEPKPSAAALLSKADVVFVNGLKLEDPTKEMANTNLKSGGEVIQLGTLTISPDEYIYDFSFPKEGDKPNPHLWTNPPMARCYAAIAASTLARADPANASHYRDNAVRYEAKVDQLDQLMKTATASMPAANRELLTYHDAYAYFASHYGWKVIGAIQLSSFEDPTPKEVADLVDQIKTEKVPAIFGSEVFPSPVLQQLASETGVKYVDKLRDDDLPGGPGDAEHSFLGLMKFDFVTMISNLGGDATSLQGFDDTDVAPDSANYPQ